MHQVPPAPLRIVVNGTTREVVVAPDTPILWVLRDVLALRGTKFGCGVGQCGACTIHLNGNPTRACVTPVSATVGARITTIEGIAASSVGRRVQGAWRSEDVPQCGYCQSGQIMAATALLAKNQSPTDAAIDAAMSGNLCRCGTYDRIRRAIHLAAAPAKTP